MYFVTYHSSSQVGRLVRAVNTVNTTDSSVIIGDLVRRNEYSISVNVGTEGGKHRSLRGSGEFNNYIIYTWLFNMHAIGAICEVPIAKCAKLS